MSIVDDMSVCYRLGRSMGEDEFESLLSKLLSIHHPIIGAYDQLIERAERYNGSSGLQITFKFPMTMKGLKYIIGSVSDLARQV